MKRSIRVAVLVLGLLLAFAATVHAQSPFAGTWITYGFPNEANVIHLQVSGSRVTGTISRPSFQTIPIYDGAISGNTVTFKTVYAGGDRITTFTGRLNGDELVFSRSVQVQPGRIDTGTGIFGGRAAAEFIARRDDGAGYPVPHALLGSWKHVLAMSSYDPGPAAAPLIVDVLNFVAGPGGTLGIARVGVGIEGVPFLDLTMLKPDGNDHPTHTPGTIARLLAEDAPTSQTRAFRVVGERAFELTHKNAGVATATRRLTVSQDGATLTDQWTIVDARGETTAANTLVWERIGPMPTTPAPTN